MARPKKFDEDLALDAAAQLFWSQGYEGTSMCDLERSLGMGRQSIYNAFGDKRALFLKALERYSSWNRDRLTNTLLRSDAGLGAIQDYFKGMVDFSTMEGPRRGCLITNSILEIGDSDAGVANSCAANQEAVLRGLEGALQNAVSAGDLEPGLDVGATARMLLSHMYGMSVMSKAGMSRDELGAAVEEVLARLK